MSGFSDERKFIENRFNAEWTATPVAYANVPFNPPANSEWVRLTILNGDSGYRAMECLKRYTGVISVQIFAPINTGSKISLEYADIIASIFSETKFDDIVTDVASIITVDVDKAWLQTNVDISYYRDSE